MRKALPLLVIALGLSGCSPWSWRAGPRYAPQDAEIASHALAQDAGLGVEAYAIGSAAIEGRDVDALLPGLLRQAARAGADALIIDELEAVTSTWNTTFTPRDRDQGVVSRREEVQVSASSARVGATALRRPTASLGLTAVCDRPYAEQSCQARVAAVLPGGPAHEAGLLPGNLITSVDGAAVAHPWDLHQAIDRSAPTAEHRLTVHNDEGERSVLLRSAACEDLYPR